MVKQGTQDAPAILADGVDPDDNPEANVGTEVLDKIEDEESLAGKVLPSIKDIINKLKMPTGNRAQPLPPSVLRTRKQGGSTLTYIDWQTALRMLDAYAPGADIVSSDPVLIDAGISDSGGKSKAGVAVRVTISIPSAEGIISRSATGFKAIQSGGYGDAVLNAERQALKRAAAMFGLGLYLYDKA